MSDTSDYFEYKSLIHLLQKTTKEIHPVSSSTAILDDIGLSYGYHQKSKNTHMFRITDKKKFFLARIKYGI